MTASYQLPLSRKFGVFVRSPEVDPRRIGVVIPVYQDWEGLRVTLDSLLRLSTPPHTITVANDNPDDSHPAWVSGYPVRVIDYPENRRPAYARNRAFGLVERTPPIGEDSVLNLARLDGDELLETRSFFYDRFQDPRLVATLGLDGEPVRPRTFHPETETPWYFFTDCGCEHDNGIFERFAEARRREGDATVAICGSVEGKGSGRINQFMSKQRILIPPMEEFLYGQKVPQALITANALVYGLAFSYLGGFRIDFAQAGGEDLDLGIRLRDLGTIAFEPAARVVHEFAEDTEDFRKRFRRYGRGNRQLELFHNLPCLRAWPFKAQNPDHQDLADLAVKAMQEGYDEVWPDASEWGLLEVAGE